MSDKAASSLSAAGTLDGTEVVYLVKGGNSRKSTVADVAAAFLLTDRAANLVLAGPATGSAVDPTFRALVTADLPDDGATNAKLADMGAYAIKIRNAATAGEPSDVAINGFTEKTTLASNDLFLIADSADSNSFKKVKKSNLGSNSTILFGSGGTGTLAAGATGYIGAALLHATEANVVFPLAIAGTLRNFRILGNNPGAVGETLTCTVRAALADTALVATITNGNNTANDTVNTVAVVAGDRISVKLVNSSGGAVQGPVSWSCEMVL